MPSKAVWYGIGAFLLVGGIVLMSVAASKIAALKTAAEKNKSPWIAGTVFGPIMILAGVGIVGATFFGAIGSNSAGAMVGTAPSANAGSATANVPAQNPVTAIENAARAKKNAAEHVVANANEIAKAAKELNAVMKASET